MTTRQPTILDAIDIEHAAEFSYSSYHADAIDYLCLFRSTALTLKAYFFDNASDDQVIVPHTHRYDFDTRVVAGELTEVRYFINPHPSTQLVAKPRAFIRFQYDCIADGGKGYEMDNADVLGEISATPYARGGFYTNRAHIDVHTLRKVYPGTVLLLTQYADEGPAHTYGWSASKPQCESEYRHMERAAVTRRVEQLHAVLSNV